MRILVLLNGLYLRRWHGWLISRLSTTPGATLAVTVADMTGSRMPSSLRLLLDAERRIARGQPAASDAISAEDLGVDVAFGEAPVGDFDTVLDLTGWTAGLGAAGQLIRPTFDGDLSEAALWGALLDHRPPRLGLEIVGSGHRDVALPAIEHPHQIRRAADQVLSRLVQVLATVATRGLDAVPQEPVAEGRVLSSRLSAAAAVRFAWEKVADKAGRALNRRLGGEARWRVGWRLAPEGGTHLDALPGLGAYSVLPDDGQRYFADPFVWVHDGVRHVFVEEFPLATGRGLISHFTISAEGRATAPRPALETSRHLSYPQIIAHEGQIYMMPECSASGAVTLYRADPFPDRWVPAFQLLDAELHDATLAQHEGRFYLFASTRDLASSSWDSLSVFSADTLTGAYEPLPGNPQLIDRRASRPAGNLYVAEGVLWRPAQDCTQGYGSALTIARITRLDRDGFAQDVASTLRMSGNSGAVHGPHTLNRVPGLEVLDFLS
jgi:hypothetical protein